MRPPRLSRAFAFLMPLPKITSTFSLRSQTFSPSSPFLRTHTMRCIGINSRSVCSVFHLLNSNSLTPAKRSSYPIKNSSVKSVGSHRIREMMSCAGRSFPELEFCFIACLCFGNQGGSGPWCTDWLNGNRRSTAICLTVCYNARRSVISRTRRNVSRFRGWLFRNKSWLSWNDWFTFNLREWWRRWF